MADEPAIPWELVPFERVGPIRFDASRDEVLALVGEPKFRHTDQAEGEGWLPDEDDYDLFSVEYDRTNQVMGVECKLPQPVTYKGWSMMGLHQSTIRGWASEHELTVRWSQFHETLWIPELGLSLWIPEVDYAPPETVTMVAAGRRDYWELVGEPEDP